MLVPFDNISNEARVWIYQADRKFTDEEEQLIASEASAFCDAWAAHGAPLKSSFRIFHQQFLVISVDEQYNAASGCSIDSSVALLKRLESKLQINFFDRTKVAFVYQDEVFLESLSQLKNKVKEGKISAQTLTFNNLVSSKGELASSWLVPAGSTWLSRYFG